MKVHGEQEEVEAAQGQGSARQRRWHFHELPGQGGRLLRGLELRIGQEERTAAGTEEVAIARSAKTGVGV